VLLVKANDGCGEATEVITWKRSGHEDDTRVWQLLLLELLTKPREVGVVTRDHTSVLDAGLL
jgi:hypothetical protein